MSVVCLKFPDYFEFFGPDFSLTPDFAARLENHNTKQVRPRPAESHKLVIGSVPSHSLAGCLVICLTHSWVGSCYSTWTKFVRLSWKTSGRWPEPLASRCRRCRQIAYALKPRMSLTLTTDKTTIRGKYGQCSLVALNASQRFFFSSIFVHVPFFHRHSSFIHSPIFPFIDPSLPSRLPGLVLFLPSFLPSLLPSIPSFPSFFDSYGHIYSLPGLMASTMMANMISTKKTLL